MSEGEPMGYQFARDMMGLLLTIEQQAEVWSRLPEGAKVVAVRSTRAGYEIEAE